MARRGTFQTKKPTTGVGMGPTPAPKVAPTAKAKATAAKPATPGTAKAKPSARAVAKASPNAAFKRTAPARVTPARAPAPRPAPSGPNLGLAGQVLYNLPIIGGAIANPNLQQIFPTGAQSAANNAALRRALGRK